MTIQQAAQSALDVQNACNLSGVAKSFAGPVMDALWGEAYKQGQGTRFVVSHPIVTLYLLKMTELNGCESTLNAAYEPAEKECIRIAGSV